MRMFDIISKKKYNESLSKEEIDYVINEYTNGTIPDYSDVGTSYGDIF